MSTGKENLLRQMRVDGVRHIFGNPGTVEQGLLDALSAFPDIEYITCLQESIAVAMADGYARKTGEPAVVQLHSGVGLGNAIGMLYQAYRGHTPLVVIAGEAGIKYDAMDAQMACDLCAMARPVVKYAARALHPSSLLRLWRRAVKLALTPPMGPVFLCLPLDILDEENGEEIRASIRPDLYANPGAEQIASVAEALSDARKPVLLVGDGVCDAGATGELERCAALVGAPVYGVNSSCINISQASPYYKGDLGHMFGANSARVVQDADVVLMIGTYAFPEVFPCLTSPFRPDAQVIHIDLNAYEIAKNHAVTLGLCAHPLAALRMLNARLEHMAMPRRTARAQELLQGKPAAQQDGSVAAAFLQCVRERTNEDLIIFDEALTSSGYVTSFLPRVKPGTFFQTRGGSLGVGIPGALGIQLASLDALVLAFTGDGGSMYTIQALHTAARYQIPVKMVICDNGRYHLLDQNLDVYRKQQTGSSGPYPDCFSLAPQINFAMLARSMGVEAVRVDTAEQAENAANRMLDAVGPFLVVLNTRTPE